MVRVFADQTGSPHQPVLLFLGLFLLGLGWSGAMISGTALLTENVPASEKVSVQGSADLLMSLSGGTAAFLSGFIKQALEYHYLSIIGTVGTFALLVYALRTMRAPATEVTTASA